MATVSAFLIHPHDDPRASKLAEELGRYGVSDLRYAGKEPVQALAASTVVLDADGPSEQLEYAAKIGRPIIPVNLAVPPIDSAREITARLVAMVPRGPQAFFIDQRGDGRSVPAVPTAFGPIPTFVVRPDHRPRTRDQVHTPEQIAQTVRRVRETVAFLREIRSGLREVHVAGDAQLSFIAAMGGLFQRNDGTRRVVHGPGGEWVDEPHLPFVPSFPRHPVLVSARPGRDQLLYVGSELQLEDAILEGRRRGLSVSYLATRASGGDWVKSMLDGIEAFAMERPDPNARLSLIWSAPAPLLALAAGRLAESICPSWGILELDAPTGRYVDHQVAAVGSPLRANRRATLPPMAGEATG